MEKQVYIIIRDALLESKESYYGKLFSSNIPMNKIEIFGNQNNGLTSLDLVSLLFLIEDEIQDQLGITLDLASEKAMSSENSPFKTVESLKNYILMIIEPTAVNE